MANSLGEVLSLVNAFGGSQSQADHQRQLDDEGEARIRAANPNAFASSGNGPASSGQYNGKQMVGQSDLDHIRNQLMGGNGGGEQININGQDYSGTPNSSISIGGQTQEGVAGQPSKYQNTLGILDQIQPLVKSNIVDKQQLGTLLTKEIGADFQTQQQQNTISRDIQSGIQQYRQGRLTDEAYERFKDGLYQQHGSALYSNPNYAQLAGVEQQQQQVRQQQQASYAKQNGIDPSLVTWDDKHNKPIFDHNAAAIQTWKANTEKVKSETDERQAKAKATTVKSFTDHLQPKPPVREDYLRNAINSAQASARFDADNAQYRADYAKWANAVQPLLGADDATMQAVHSLTGAAAPADTSLKSQQPTDLNVIDKKIKAGFAEPGWYIGLDGKKKFVDGK